MATRYKAGSTPDSEWEALGERLNKHINLDKIESEEDYYEALERVFSKDNIKFPKNHYPDIYNNNEKVQGIIKEKQQTLTLYQKAQRYERRRRRNSRIPDERRTSKRLVTKSTLTRGRYSKWRKHPSQSDILGIDSKVSARASMPKNLITNSDLALKKYKVLLHRNGIKSYRDLRGRFSRNPYRRK